MARDTRTKPRVHDSIEWLENGERHVVTVIAIDGRGCVFYTLDGVEHVTTLTVWPKLAARWR